MKVLDKKIGNTKYIKYRINIPKKVAEDSELLDKEVQARAEKKKIIIEEELYYLFLLIVILFLQLFSNNSGTERFI
jgi:nitrogen fixation/metabolism regulation signal transduction histidine kinase